MYPIFFANESNILSYLEILPPCALSSNLGEEMANKEGLEIGVLAGVDGYGHFLVVYTRFWEEDGVGTKREGVFTPRQFLWSSSAKCRYTFEGHTIRTSTSKHHKSFSIHGCMHYCIFQSTILKVGDSISNRWQGVCNWYISSCYDWAGTACGSYHIDNSKLLEAYGCSIYLYCEADRGSYLSW